MKKNLCYVLLLVATFSCEKESSVGPGPKPWKPAIATQSTEDNSAAKAVDCTSYPLQPPSNPYCDQHRVFQPVGIGCKKDTVVEAPPPVKDTCCR
jgi:hypothetical protein